MFVLILFIYYKRSSVLVGDIKKKKIQIINGNNGLSFLSVIIQLIYFGLHTIIVVSHHAC